MNNLPNGTNKRECERGYADEYKTCPACDAHVRFDQSACDCGYNFEEINQRVRAIETEQEAELEARAKENQSQ